MKVTQNGRPFLLGVISLLLAAPIWAAIGDNAPPIPSTFRTSHPRLPSPDSAFLTSLAGNATALADYNSEADAWNSVNPSGTWQLRRLVIAYMANKIANPVKAATYLAKIKALADLGGSWGKVLLSANDGVGNGAYNLTSASANFLTGCAGVSCVGEILSINARTFIINSVIDAHTVVLKNSNPAPSGSNLQIRVFSVLNTADINIALIYDWLYNDLDAATKTAFLNQLDVLATEWEENYIGLNASPYNDVFYIRNGISGLIDALVLYPDHPNGLKHMKFMTDVWFNVLLPVWKQVFGPEGGGWHENWEDYVRAANGNGLTSFIVPSLLSWQVASGDPIFSRESWLKNFAYFSMYTMRPDYLMDAIGDASRPYMVSESPALGSLNGLAEIYNDPVLRGWARFVNGTVSQAPDGFEPSAWPFYTPMKKSNPGLDRSALPPVRNFTGWGLLSARTGWSENDTAVTLKYGDNFWSHEHFDSGAFTIFSRGLLALDSGSYRSGSLSKHENQYARQTIAHNTLTITDPTDIYPTTFDTYDENGNVIQLAPPNDGGQRRVGTLYNQRFAQLSSPSNVGQWMSNWDYYHMGKMVAYASTANYTYTAVDITHAYNNKFSATTPNATNRTNRVQKAVRHLLFIPRGTSAYIIIFDQVISTNASFAKRWILHTVNQPFVSGNRFEVLRKELVTSLPFVDVWPDKVQNLLTYKTGTYPNLKYQYDGKLYGWMVQPQAGTINVVGGPGKEFWVEDPLHPGTGTNWNQCMKGQCAANVEGLGPVQDFINPISATAPHEPGSWRIEVKPSTPATQDYFLHVMFATTSGNTNVPATVTVPSGLAADQAGATWVEGGKTYTVAFPKSGVGGHIAITGAVDEELLSQAQQLPDQLQIVSGTPQSAASFSAVASPLIVVAKDSAGRPVPNVVVHFAITQGNGRLTPSSASTDSQGRASVNLSLGAGAVGSTTRVMADINGLPPVEFAVTISGGGTPPTTPPPSTNSVSCAPTNLTSHAAATCTVTLTAAAGSGGVTVPVSSNSTLLTVPASVVVPSGATNSIFTAVAGTVSASQSAVVTVSFTEGSLTASLALQATTSSGASIPLNSWTMVKTNGFPPSVVGYSNMIYASGVKKFVMWENYHNLTSETNQAMLAYDFPSNRWDVWGLNGNFHTEQLPESGHAVGMLQYNPGNNTLINYCCHSGSQGYERPQHTWIYDPVGLVGRDVQPPTMPGLASESQAAFDNFNQVYVLFGLEVGTWIYDPTKNTWTKMTPNGTLPTTSGFFSGMAYNSTDHKIYLFGGHTQTAFTNDLFTYDVPSNTWTKLNPSGVLPSGRKFPGFAYDSLNNVFLMVSGTNASGTLHDTWLYDPVQNSWTELQPTTALPASTQASFQRLAYDPDDNVFALVWAGAGGYANGSSVGYAVQTWFYRYHGTGPQVGALSPTFAPSPSAINRSADAWSNEPAIASNGSTIYAGWIETGQPFATGNLYYPHIYASQLADGDWSQLGSSYLSLDSELNGYNEAHAPSLAMVGSKLWISWYKTNNSGTLLPNSLYAKYWNGSSWIGGPVGGVDTTSKFIIQNRSQLANAGSVAHIAFLENNRNCYPWCQYLYVKRWNGSSWSLVGPGALNRNASAATASPLADSVSMTSDGTNPIVAWTEYTQSSNFKSNTPPQVYVDIWSGSAWTPMGGSLNVNSSNWAYDASVAYFNGQPYVAWVERSQAGTPQLYVKTWNGSAWGLVGSGSLNKAGTGWAFRPALAADASGLFVAWVEQQSLGQEAQTYVAKYNGGSWSALGSSLNVDSAQGSAERVSLAVLNGQPVAAWGEVKHGSLRQIYAKQWNGSAWTLLAGTPSQPGSAPQPITPPPPTSPSCDLNGDGVVTGLDVQVALGQALGTIPCSTADLQSNGRCDVVDVQRVINAALGGSCLVGP